VKSISKDIDVVLMVDVYKEGPAVMRNRGAKKATGDVLFFMDSDSIIYPDTIDKIIKRLEEDPTLDGITAIWDSEPLEDNFFNKFKALEMNYTMKNYFKTACASNGTAIRKEVFFDVGGFDEEFKEPIAEDFYFGLKVLSRGYNVVIDKDILMQHSFCNTVWSGLIKYSRRAYHRAKLLVEMGVESSYNSNKLKLIYASTLFPPLFFVLNLGLYKTFMRYGVPFTIRATILHYIYMLVVAISGGLGYANAYLSKKFSK